MGSDRASDHRGLRCQPTRQNPQASLITGPSTSGYNPESSENWADPQPLPPALAPVRRFDLSLLPDTLRGYIADIAERVQCPPGFPAVAVVVALAGLVGRQIGIKPKRRDDWVVVPNLWGAVIGRPGVMKTPALREPLKPLSRLEIEAKKEYAQQFAGYEAEKAVSEARLKEAKKRLQKAVGDEDKEAVAAAQKELNEQGADPPLRRRHLINDSTVEKLGELLNENPHGVLVYRDELMGLLRGLEKQGQPDDPAVPRAAALPAGCLRGGRAGHPGGRDAVSLR